MADAIRIKTLVLWEKRRKIANALSGPILPGVIHQLNAASKELGHLKVTKGNITAEVTVWFKGEEVRRHIVYLEQQECTCRQWQVSGKPCSHALAVITRGENGTDIFRPYLRPNSFRGVQICPYSKSGYSISDTVSIFEYSNRIFMMSIYHRILSDKVDIIRIRI
jgi:hypothetical protein